MHDFECAVLDTLAFAILLEEVYYTQTEIHVLVCTALELEIRPRTS